LDVVVIYSGILDEGLFVDVALAIAVVVRAQVRDRANTVPGERLDLALVGY
jgi:hypothetical protein